MTKLKHGYRYEIKRPDSETLPLREPVATQTGHTSGLLDRGRQRQG